MILPQLPARMQRSQQQVISLRGVNYSDNFTDGDLAECRNLSTRRYPYMAARNGRKALAQEGVTALTSWEKLVMVTENGELLFDGEAVGEVAPGKKQFAVVNTKLIIWPDKVYLDMESREVKPLWAEITGEKATFTTDTMTVSGWEEDLTKLFKAGDCITISGCAEESNNKDIVLRSVTEKTLTVSANGFTAAKETGEITLERRIPELDYICESENRLWGCSNEKRTIYASALGDPTNFFVYEGLSTDAYALAVGSEGDFTGCCKLGTSVLFWKETTLHKMLGSYPAEYSLYTYKMEGLREGCHKSMAVINEVLFYMGLHGVYAYSGGTPSLISPNFGEKVFTKAVAGSDGKRYYISASDGERRRLLVYDTIRGIWMEEDETDCADFARTADGLYFLTTDGRVYLADSGTDDADIRWSATFAPFFGTVKKTNSTSYTLRRKRLCRVQLRLQVPQGSWVLVETRTDGGDWMQAGRIIGEMQDRAQTNKWRKADRTTQLTVGINRCDKYEIRLSGKGPFALLAMQHQFQLGSEV